MPLVVRLLRAQGSRPGNQPLGYLLYRVTALLRPR